jgi:hypothetical protein
VIGLALQGRGGVVAVVIEGAPASGRDAAARLAFAVDVAARARRGVGAGDRRSCLDRTRERDTYGSSGSQEQK